MPTACRARRERETPPRIRLFSVSQSRSRRRPWSSASSLFLVLLLVACPLFLLSPVAAFVTVPVPTTPNFRFDGQHSDFAQQYYMRFLAGDSVPPISRLKSDGVPPEIRAVLGQLGLRWTDLPGLLQRAVLWDYGYVFADGNGLVQIRTRCGRSMAQIFVSKKAYERMGCTPKACSVSTGEITYRHQGCQVPQATAMSLCAADDASVSSHSDMWGVGADDDLIPDVTLQRHTWGDDSSQLMYSLHAVHDDVAYNFCPRRPSLIIPCAPYSLEKEPTKWCRPERGPIVTPWLAIVAAAKKPHNSWIIFEIVLVMMFLGSMIYGTSKHLRNKENSAMLEQEFEELREALLVWRQGARKDKASEARTTEAGAMEELENALDAAACEYFDSSIGLFASSNLDVRDLLATSSRRSFSLSLVHEEEEEGDGSELMLDESFGPSVNGSRSQRRLDRSISSSSAISLLSGRRSQVALRSFHLFERHSLIRRRRVPFREILFHELLSQGNSGEVWRCTLRGQQVAVKQLLPTKRRLLKEMELFMAEVYLLSQLLHPNIVTLVGVAWNTLEHVVMVQEWLQRGDLQGFLKLKRDALPTGRPRLLTINTSCSEEEEMVVQDDDDDDARVFRDSAEDNGDNDDESFTWRNHKLEIALSVARALSYLHGLTPQLLHRDVKSKNVLLSDAMEVKLCDFGISRRKHHMDEDETNLTVTEAAGTMSWTAPEVLLGDDYGDKVDIYSYGILLCEVDTCVLPYHDEASLASRLIYHPLRLMKMVTSTGLRPAISPQCPPRIAQLIHACLDGDPEKRPAAYEIVSYLSKEDVV